MKSPCLAITIDVEWAPLSIVNEMVGLLTKNDIPATLFCTDEPQLLRSPLHEYALHPHFHGQEDWDKVLASMKKLYPEAVGIRAHFLHSDTRLVRVLPGEGFLYQSNLFVPGQGVAPYQRESGLWEIPVHYMDFFHLCVHRSYPKGFTLESMPSRQPLTVVDFHPIPWFVNAATIEDYNRVRNFYSNEAALSKKRRKGEGVAKLFDRLIKSVKEGQWRPVTLSQVARSLEKSERKLWQWPGMRAKKG